MHPVQVLRCCEEALAELEVADPGQRWLWSIRRKVVTYCLHRLSDKPDVHDPHLPLSEPEVQAIRRTHPLLQPRSVPPVAIVANADWMTKIRARVDAYLAGVKSRSADFSPPVTPSQRG